MSAETDRLAAGESTRAVRLSTGSVTLEGELIVPPRAEGLVLFAHGSGSSRHSPRNRVVAQLLHQAGLGTFRFDLLTLEEAGADASRGHLRFNIGLLTQRLVCAAHWVAEEDEARHLRLGFFGASTGGRPDLAGNALRRIKAPTLLIVGERDERVLELNEEAYGMLGCEKSLEVVRGASHLFEEPGALEEVARLASGWFLERLRPFAGARFTR